MELPEHAPLQERPETLDAVGVDTTVYIPLRVPDYTMGQHLLHPQIALVFVGYQGGLVGVNPAPNESPHILGLHLVFVHGLRRNVALALGGPHHGSLVRSSSSRPAAVRIGSTLTRSRLAANIGLIHLNNPRQQIALVGLGHGLANLHIHPPGRILVDLEVPGELKRGDPLLGVQHQAEGQEPLLKGKVGMVKDGPTVTLKPVLQV